MARLGIIDWGIGGVGVYKLIRNELHVPVTYLSDTGVTPYGKMSRNALVARLNEVIEYLKALGVSHFVIGCNAASTAIPYLAEHDVPVLGVIEPAIEMTAKLKPRRLGVIGGRRTVLSGAYRKGFGRHRLTVSQRVAQPLSGLIESGDLSSGKLHEHVRTILAPLRNSSHILLACTHYPAITDVLKEHVSPGTKFIDPSAALLKAVKRWGLEPGLGGDDFLTTGNASAMKRAAQAAFAVSIPNARRVRL